MIEENVNAAQGDSVQVIAANNPSKDDMQGIVGSIQEAHGDSVVVRATTFNFKKTKNSETGIETQREAVVLPVPYPSIEGIVAILEEGGKGLELLASVMAGVVNDAARAVIYTDTSVDATNFDVNQVSWEAIANRPKTQRKGGGIPKEVWAGFAQDYVEVMPEVTGKTIDQVTAAAKILANKLVQVRTNEPVLQLMVAQLALYAEHSSNIDTYEECVTVLLAKAETFLTTSDEELLANL